jgi:tRNA/tmRNA/rRNA uracil-C5-methylase (TrmA/RlmC/RlmD family)
MQGGGREWTDWSGRTFEVEIGPVAHGGHCVARFENRVVFVRHALPGELCVVQVTEDHGGAFCRGDAVQVLRAAPERVTPPCPLARPGGCGGCDWQHASPAAQRELKAAVIAEQLHRLAGLDLPVTVEELPGGNLGWRTRLRLAVDREGRTGLRGHRSHQVLPLADCPIAVPGLLDGVGDQPERPGTEIELVRDATGRRHLAERRPVPKSKNWRTTWRTGGRAEEHAGGRTWKLRADGFWQVHPALADTLAELVRDWAKAPVGGRAWDLYGGVGLFAAVLAEQVGDTGSVLLVESVRTAVGDAEANLKDLPQVRCVTGRVEKLLRDDDGTGDDSQLGADPDVVVVDPPRKGLGGAVVDALAGRHPERVVYVACDPAALARDVATFAGHGYRLTALRAFDAFPMTQHVECVALLER